MFWSLALLIGLAAIGVWIRFAVAYAEGNGKGHVQSLILGAVLFIAAVVLWALGVIGDLLAAQRVMTQRTFERDAPDRAAARRRALPLRTRAAPRSRPSSAGARRDGAGCERRDGLQGRGRHRQHLRQVRLEQPGRAAADGRLRARRSTSFSTLAAPGSVLDVGCGEGVLVQRWAQQLGHGRVVGIDLEEESIQAGWAERTRRRTSSTA